MIGFLHFLPINRREKLLAYSFWGNQDFVKRPECKVESEMSYKCIGMPSGHVEGITVCTYFLFRNKVLPIEWFLFIVTLMSIQRILVKKHTILQVLAGLSIGIIYGEIYTIIIQFIINKYEIQK